KYNNDISGNGARKQYSNRWNSYGTPMLYTAESAALCAVELNKAYSPYSKLLNYYLLEIETPNQKPLLIDAAFYEEDWINNIQTSKLLGDFFVNENEFLTLKVASVWIQNCYNYLINPNHKDFNKVKIIAKYSFPFTGKLFNKM
ncbi:MAG: RES family NAD+ phosphorylase, partial [Marinirhabdus sp.]